MPPPGRIVFRRSSRLFAMRLSILLLLTFGGLLLLTRADWGASAGITSLGALVAVVWYFLTRHRAVYVTADEVHLTRVDHGEPLRIRWVDVQELVIGESLLPQRNGVAPVRYALVRGIGSQRIVFADLTFVDNRALWVATPEPTPVTDVADSDILLAIVADRLGDERFLPRPAAAPADGGAEQPSDAAPETQGEGPARPTRGRRTFGPGLLALVLKLGGKAIKPVLGLFKGSQALLALASGAALAALWSWQGALALMAMLLFHEYGHVHAMRRSGIHVRGIYFIPLVGAAAVADDIWRTRGQQAYIALSGPLWGAALTVAPIVVVALTGDRYPIVAAIAALWALVNLFNLLPISPLDGGRLLSSIGYSVHTSLGLALSIASLVAAVGLAFVAQLYLFALLGAVGLAELLTERSVASRARRLSFARCAPDLKAEDLARLRPLTRPAFPARTEAQLRGVELARATRMLKMARITPMRPLHAALWFVAYLATAAGLAGALIWIATVHPDLQTLVEVLR